MAVLAPKQLIFFDTPLKFPSTRYQGSKLKIIDWIWDNIRDLKFNTVLDAFGGTGCVSYMLKFHGKEITYNDILKFNWYIGLALIENNSIQLEAKDLEFILKKHSGIKYSSFIYDTFKDIYYTDYANKWLDVVVANIFKLDNIYKKALAFYALFQSCIIKRPFNLFHRKNLYIRFSDVKRNFGNKTTWDKSFNEHFTKFVNEGNKAIFNNGKQNKAINKDIFKINKKYDLVYIDTPYISKEGVGVNYLDFYHFLEGMVNYSNWKEMIDYKSKHKRLKKIDNPWSNKNKIYNAFEKLITKYKDSILVISYRSDGIPDINNLIKLLKKYKPTVEEVKKKNYKYVLSHNNKSEEVLLIAK